MKKISFIEIISLLVIIAVLIIIFVPKVTDINEKSKKESYVEEVKDFVNKAKTMYENKEIKENNDYFLKTGKDTETAYSIVLGKIDGITDYVDPFGYLYDTKDSVITFYKENSEEKIKVSIKSCDPNKASGISNCYEIVDVNYDSLDDSKVKYIAH